MGEIFTAAVAFFCEKMDLFITILTCDITTYKGGAIWNAVSMIYDCLLPVGIVFAGIFVWLAFFESTGRFIEAKRASPYVLFLMDIIIVTVILHCFKYFLLLFLSAGQGIARKVMQTVGMLDAQGNSIFNMTIPETFYTCIDNAGFLSGTVITVIVLLASIWIVISTLTVLITVYGRLYNLYLLVAICPLPVAAAISRPTRFVATNFVKTFLSVVLEAVVLVIALYLFQTFFSSGFDNIMPENIVTQGITGNVNVEGLLSGEPMYTPLQAIFKYLSEISFLFLLLVGIMKGTDRIVNKIFGL